MRKIAQTGKTNLAFIGVILIALSVALFLLFFLRGSTKVEGGYPEPISNSSLECTSENSPYPFFNFNKPAIKNVTSINIIFYNDEIDKISLTQLDTYTDETTASSSSSVAHANMNNSFAKSGLKADALSANYSATQNTMRMTLYASTTEFNNNSSKYFLLDEYLINQPMDTIEKYYSEKGFSCASNNQNNERYNDEKDNL